MPTLQDFQALLARGIDNALLRFSLGSAHYQVGQLLEAESHLQRAVEQDPHYSAAWKMYGRVLLDSGKTKAAVEVFNRGINVAQQKGDLQAVKEMQVFLRRALKQLEPARPG